MEFAEFTKKYHGKITNVDKDIPSISAETGLDTAIILNWVLFWMKVQADTVKAYNRMPTVEEVIAIHEGVPPPTPAAPPKPVVKVDPTAKSRSAYNPAGYMVIGQLTVPQFQELMDQILDEHFK